MKLSRHIALLFCITFMLSLAQSGTARLQNHEPEEQQTTPETWIFKGLVVGPAAGNENDEGTILMANLITLEDGTFRMYYNKSIPGRNQIRCADSPDGVKWTVRGTCIQGSTTTTDRNHIVGGASVVRLPDKRFRMYARVCPQPAPNTPPKYHVRSYLSNDGITFTEEGIRIDITPNDPASQFVLVGHSSIYQLADGTYGAILSANLATEAKDPSNLFVATSKDGLTWSNFKKVYQGFHDPTVVKKEGKYYLFAQYLHFEHYRMISSDGVTWPATGDKVLLMDDQGNDMQKQGVGDLGGLVLPDGRIRIYGNHGQPQQNISMLDPKDSTTTGTKPTVQVMTPNGGEKYETATRLTIAWTSQDDQGVVSHSLDLSADGGQTYGTSLASGLTGTMTSFQAALPQNLETNRARVRVRAFDSTGNTGEDTSDADFSIVKAVPADTPPTVRVLSPNGGEQVPLGSPVSISWQSSDDTGLVSHGIDLSLDGGATFPFSVVTGLSGTAQNFSTAFTVSAPSQSARIRVQATDRGGKTSEDTSDANFSLFQPKPADTTPPVVTVLAPNGGEKLKTGDSFLVVWKSSDNESITGHDLSLSTDGGTTFTTTVTTGLPGSTQSFVFVVPGSLATTKTARIRVTATDGTGNRGQDDSDGNFRIKQK